MDAEMTEAFVTLRQGVQELREARLEIQRHHRDFEKISEICHSVLDNKLAPQSLFEEALRWIRNIVG